MSLYRVRQSLITALLALSVLPFVATRLAAQSGIISGKVTDAGTGRPVENAQIQAAMNGGQSYGAISGADGAFRVINLPDGTFTVTVRAIGFEPRVFSAQRPGANLVATLTERATQLNQTVVTASRNRPEKQLDAPAQISVITSEQVAERPSVTITDHLRSTPGVDINKGGIAQANIVSRGFNNAFSGSMLMLQDYRFAGVPSLRVNVPFLFTGTNEDIDRIEVLLGPASALYGPNSSNGVLHVITKSPFNSQGTTVSLDGGERSVIRAGLRHAGKLNEKFAYKLSGEYMQGHDWEYNDRAEVRTFPTTANVPVDRRGKATTRDFDLNRYSGEARIDVRPNASSEAITTVGYTNLGSGIELTSANGTAQIKNWTYTSLQQRFRYNRFFAQAFLNLSDAGNDTSTSGSGTYLLRSGQPIVDQSRVAAGQLQHGFDIGTKQSFTYGADYIWTNPRTGGTINGANENVDNVTEYGAYVQSTTRPTSRFEILLAARGDANNVIDGSFFSPRAALIFKPTANQNVRVTYNRAFSTPGNFSFFLDLIQSPNAGGSGFDVRALGNTPKTGLTFRRDCGSAQGGLCMKSPYAGAGSFVPTSAASSFNGFVTGRAPAFQAGIAASLQANGIPAANAAGLATLAVNALRALAPTDANLSTRLAYLTSGSVNIDPTKVTDIAPLKASFNNTYEVGYKGIIGNRFRYDVSYYGQERGDVGTSAAVSTPSVFIGNPQQLGGYLAGPLAGALGPALTQAGLTPAQVQAIVGGVTTSLTTSIASAPLGVVTFDNGSAPANVVYATYFNVNKKIWVNGLDIATDIVATDRLTFDVNFSYQSKNIFYDVPGGNGAPLMSNSPNSRGSVGMRYRNENNGMGFELRTRYSESYPVNSGVYATNVAYPIAAGQAGASATPVPSTSLGYNKCNPAAAGTFCYENVPETFIFDAQVSKRFDIGAKKLTWSINAANLFDNPTRTFPGVPEIGRLVMTRLQYAF